MFGNDPKAKQHRVFIGNLKRPVRRCPLTKNGAYYLSGSSQSTGPCPAPLRLPLRLLCWRRCWHLTRWQEALSIRAAVLVLAEGAGEGCLCLTKCAHSGICTPSQHSGLRTVWLHLWQPTPPPPLHLSVPWFLFNQCGSYFSCTCVIFRS